MSRQPEIGVARLSRISVRATDDELRQLDWMRGPDSTRSDFIRQLVREENVRRARGPE